MVKDNAKESKKSSGSDGANKPTPYRDIKWFNPTLNSTDLAWLESNGTQLGDLFLSLLDGLSEGQRLSLKYDSNSTRWLGILFAGSGDDPNTGYAMSVRGATSFDAGVLLGYFHLVKFDGNWEVVGDKTDGRWG